MKSGTYWEYWCKCGWMPSEFIGFNPTLEQDEMAKKRIEQKVIQHVCQKVGSQINENNIKQ